MTVLKSGNAYSLYLQVKLFIILYNDTEINYFYLIVFTCRYLCIFVNIS